MPIQVAYDLSDLARFHSTGYTSGGTPRVIESVAENLLADSRCHVTFSALRGSAAVVAYCRRKSAFRTARVGVSGVQRIGGHLINCLRGSAGATPRRFIHRMLSKAAGIVRRACAIKEGIPAQVLEQVEIFHVPGLSAPPERHDRFAYQRFVTIYDLIPKLHPELVDPAQVERMTATLAKLRDDDWIACISETVKKDVCTHTSIAPSRVFVTPLGALSDTFHSRSNGAEISAMRSRYGLAEQDYFLTMSSLSPHKNLLLAIRSFGAFIQMCKLPGPCLALGNLRESDAAALANVFEDYPDLRSQVVFVGVVRECDMAALYRGAAGFLFPSLAEGFGLPVLEAMQCGAPVVASDIPVIREVAGKAVILVDPHDKKAWAQAILRLYSSHELQDDLRVRGVARSKIFSWKRCTDATVAAYEAALQTGCYPSPNA